MGEILKTNHTIRVQLQKLQQTLNLTHNEITDEGVYKIVAGLEKNEGLVELFLNDNLITNNGAVSVAELIEKHKTLEELGI